MKKKIFSILLSLAMVITMMPAMTMTSWANETTQLHLMIQAGVNNVTVTSAGIDNIYIELFNVKNDADEEVSITCPGKKYKFCILCTTETYDLPNFSDTDELYVNGLKIDTFSSDAVYDDYREISFEYTFPLQSTWSKLSRAMYGEEQGTVTDEFEVDDTTTPGTRIIKLLNNISANTSENSTDSALTVPSGESIVLNLNGYVIDRGLVSADGKGTMQDEGSVIVDYGNLTINDSNTGNNSYKFKVLDNNLWKYIGLWTGGDTETDTIKKVTGGIITGGVGESYDEYDNAYNGAGLYVKQEATCTLNVGNIVGNASGGDNSDLYIYGGGAGVSIAGPSDDETVDGGSFIMNGGTICGNIADSCGSAVDNANSFTMNGGKIINNFIGWGAAIHNCPDANCTITGGDICNNKASQYVGAILNRTRATLKMVSGQGKTIKVTGNYSSVDGAGVVNDGIMHLGGKVIIKDNYSEGVYNDTIHYPHDLTTYSPITIDSALTGSEIKITRANSNGEHGWDDGENGILTSGYLQKNSGAGVSTFFSYDGPDVYHIELENGELVLKEGTPSEEYTIPVEGEDTVQIEASITEGKAVVKEISADSLEEVIKPKDGKKTTTDTIKIDLSGAEQEVKSVELTKTSVENLADVTASKDNDIKNVEISLTNASVILDSKALNAINDQAEGDSIQLVVDNTKVEELEPAQQESLSKYEVASTFEAYFEDSKGNEIHDFKGGVATVSIKFEPEHGKKASNYKVYYVEDSGKLTKYATRFANGLLKFATTHFSDYAIVYDTAVDVLLLKAKTSGSKAVKLSWNSISNATKYVVYGAKCGNKYKKVKTTTGKSYTLKKIAGKKLKAHKAYKFYVVGYDAVGNKVQSKSIHFVTANTQGKYANVKSIKAKKTSITLTVGGKAQKVGAKYKMYKGKKHIKKNHGAALRYVSTNPGVAKVSSSGKVTPISVGKATIYIQDIGGRYCKTTVTVK